MQIIKKELNIDFVGQSKYWIAVSSILILASFICFFTKGFNYGIDFSGGTAIQLKFKADAKASSDRLRGALEKINMESASVQEYGSKESMEYLIKVKESSTPLDSYDEQLKKAIGAEFGADNTVEAVRYAPDKVYVTMAKDADPVRIQKGVSGLNIPDLKLEKVEMYGKASNREYLIEFSGITKRIAKALDEVFGAGNYEILKADVVGPKVGGELRRDAILATFLALFFILIYIWLRFDIEFAPGGVLCLLHDALITAGVFSFMGLEVDTTFVASILTIIGYSINDTIVVYDRIRENMGLLKNESFPTIINRSINQTMSRTILTSLTVLFITAVLLIFGGPILFGMSLALTIGLFIGSYSTIFIATPLTLYISKRRRADLANPAGA